MINGIITSFNLMGNREPPAQLDVKIETAGVLFGQQNSLLDALEKLIEGRAIASVCDVIACDAVCDAISCDAICDGICDEICDAVCDAICDLICDKVCDEICDKIDGKFAAA